MAASTARRRRAAREPGWLSAELPAPDIANRASWHRPGFLDVRPALATSRARKRGGIRPVLLAWRANGESVHRSARHALQALDLVLGSAFDVSGRHQQANCGVCRCAPLTGPAHFVELEIEALQPIAHMVDHDAAGETGLVSPGNPW